MIEVDWSDEEIRKIKKLYPFLPNKDLSILLKRSVNSIQHKADVYKRQ